MSKQQTLTIVVPDDADLPVYLVGEALDRYCAETYPTIILGFPSADRYPHDTAILIIEED